MDKLNPKSTRKSASSVDQNLQLFHWDGSHSFRCRLCFEDTRLFREWIHALFSLRRRPHFHLQVEHTSELERPALFHLVRCERQHTFNGIFYFLRLQTLRLSDSTVGRGNRHGRATFHRGFHPLHGSVLVVVLSSTRNRPVGCKLEP